MTRRLKQPMRSTYPELQNNFPNLSACRLAAVRRMSICTNLQIRTLLLRLKNSQNNVCDLLREEWRDGVTDLAVLGRARAAKQVVVGERLNTRSLPDSETTTLRWIVMNVVVTVFGDVTGNGSRGPMGYLHPKSVIEVQLLSRYTRDLR